MTQNFIDNARMLAGQLTALCEQADTINFLKERFSKGENATLYLKIGDETISFRDFKADEKGTTIYELLNEKEKQLMNCFEENADSLATFCEEEKSR